MTAPHEPTEPQIKPVILIRTPTLRMSIWDLFRLFFKLGWTFGAGTAMTALLQDELVRKRHLVTRSDFMNIYGLARIVPSGSTTAIAVAFGHRFGGMLGTVIALLAMILPAFTITVLLTIGREQLQGTAAFPLLNLTLMPAALAIVIVSTWKLAQEFFRPTVEPILAAMAVIGILVFHINAPILLVAGGLIGAFTLRERHTHAERDGGRKRSEERQSSDQTA
jgi:chromate transporter